LKMRRMLVTFVLGMLATSTAHAQWKPEKPVEIIIGTSAGGPQDRAGRLIQKILQEQRLVTAPINVLNRPGGGGVIGLTYLGQQPGDAHYMMVNSITLFTNHITGRTQLSYADFTPLAVIGAEYVGVAVLADSPLKTARNLAERLRSDPGSLSVSIGTAFGNATHISHALAMKAAGVDIRKMKTVVFNSGGDAMTALLGGHVDAMASAPSTLRQHVKSGKVRLLAIVAPQRLAGDFAAVPTWKELGIDVTFDLGRRAWADGQDERLEGPARLIRHGRRLPEQRPDRGLLESAGCSSESGTDGTGSREVITYFRGTTTSSPATVRSVPKGLLRSTRSRRASGSSAGDLSSVSFLSL
jgi:putative tricarboxylic transport membrane protein